MKRLVAVFAAVVALVYGVADTATAKVLYTETNTFSGIPPGGGIEGVLDYIYPGAGPVLLTFTSDAVITGGFVSYIQFGGAEHLYCGASSCTPDGTGWIYSGWDPCYGAFVCYGEQIPVDLNGTSSFSAKLVIDPSLPDLAVPAGTWPEGTGSDVIGFWNAGIYVDLLFDSRSNGKTYTLTIASIPEPATWATMIIGLFGLGAMLRRRRAVQALAA